MSASGCLWHGGVDGEAAAAALIGDFSVEHL